MTKFYLSLLLAITAHWSSCVIATPNYVSINSVNLSPNSPKAKINVIAQAVKEGIPLDYPALFNIFSNQLTGIQPESVLAEDRLNFLWYTVGPKLQNEINSATQIPSHISANFEVVLSRKPGTKDAYFFRSSEGKDRALVVGATIHDGVRISELALAVTQFNNGFSYTKRCEEKSCPHVLAVSTSNASMLSDIYHSEIKNRIYEIPSRYRYVADLSFLNLSTTNYVPSYVGYQLNYRLDRVRIIDTLTKSTVFTIDSL